MNTSRRQFAGNLIAGVLPLAAAVVKPHVEVEEPVYEFTPADNGAGPLWDYGAPGLVRQKGTVIAAGLDTLPNVKPLHNCRWALHRRGGSGWHRLLADEKDRQREPCPIALFEDGRLFLSTNPTLTPPNTYSGPADPQILAFSTKDFKTAPTVLRPTWSGKPRLSEHTYRGFAADARAGELLVLHNNGSGAPEAYWAFLDRSGAWRNQGIVRYPIRGCYPQVALRNGAAHILAVGDIMEPIPEWRKWKFEKSGGRQWDYVFRRLFYVSNTQVATEQFGDVLEVANVDETAGHITNLDLWLDREGAVHLLYLKRNIASAVMRDRFFPSIPLTSSLEHSIIRRNQVSGNQTLLAGSEGAGTVLPAYARFHATPKGRLFVFASSRIAAPASYENRLIEILPNLTHSEGTKVDLRYPFTNFITATERGGSRPSDLLDVLGLCSGAPGTTIRYARIRL